MVQTEKVPIVRKHGITLYGRVINKGGKLGNFEVIDNLRGHEGEFSNFADAESKFKYLTSIREKK